MADEALYTEEHVPPIDRVLGLRGVLAEPVVKLIKKNMRTALRSAAPTLPPEERAILEKTVSDFLALDRLKSPVYASVSTGYADIPLGKIFSAVFSQSNPREGAATKCVLRAVINEWTPIAMDGIPRGHRCICLFEFPEGIPALIKRLPAVGYPTPATVENKVFLASAETWELRGG